MVVPDTGWPVMWSLSENALGLCCIGRGHFSRLCVEFAEEAHRSVLLLLGIFPISEDRIALEDDPRFGKLPHFTAPTSPFYLPMKIISR